MGGCIVYTGFSLLLLILRFISSFFFLSNFQTLNIFVTLFSGTVEDWNLVHTWTVVGWLCIPESGCCCLFVPLFFHFSSSNFQTLKIFVTLFSGTSRPRRLRLGAHVDNGWTYRVYGNQAAAAYLSLISSFFFLSNFQTLKFFVTLFSGTVRHRRLKLGTHMDIGQMYRVYRNQAAALIRPSISSFFFLSNF